MSEALEIANKVVISQDKRLATIKEQNAELRRLAALNAELVAENESLKDNVYVLNKTLADLGFELKTVQL